MRKRTGINSESSEGSVLTTSQQEPPTPTLEKEGFILPSWGDIGEGPQGTPPAPPAPPPYLGSSYPPGQRLRWKLTFFFLITRILLGNYCLGEGKPRCLRKRRRKQQMGGKKKKKKTGQACEIPNRTGKNNIINYGSPQAASGQALCGTSPGTRRARVSSVVRACGWQGPLRPPWGDESRAHPGTQGTATPSRPSSDRLCWRGSPSVGRACGPQGRAGQAGAGAARGPRAAGDSCARARGRRRASRAGRPSGPGLLPRPRREGQVKVSGGGARWAPRPGPRSRPPSAPPAPGAHLALCPSCRAAGP